jgi:hypothetical protein
MLSIMILNEGTFNDENNQTINKVKVIPKRDNEPYLRIHLHCRRFFHYAIDLDIKAIE